MRVIVQQVSIPAMSTIGMASGVTEDGKSQVSFYGDHRPLRDIGLALQAGKEVITEVNDYQLYSVVPVDEADFASGREQG